ncbi:GNAT family N-acetyltransferase [bacterium]|nr:GNAT family N-acetyltransferase [bacterium]
MSESVLSRQFALRPLLREDTPALLRLWNRACLFDPCSLDLLEQKIWGDPDADQQTSLAYGQGRLEGFVMALRRPNGVNYLKALMVDPEQRRSGLGTALLESARRALPQGPLRVCESAPDYVVPGVDVRYTPAICFLEKHGFKRVGECYNLLCDLNQNFLEEPRTGVRRALPSDFDTVMSFLEKHWKAWQYEVGKMFENDPISLHLGFEGDRLMGFSGYDGNTRGQGCFGPMGTDPEARGTGLGGVLLKRCLADLKAQGHPEAVIPWVGPYAFYSKQCGARIERVFWRYELV